MSTGKVDVSAANILGTAGTPNIMPANISNIIWNNNFLYQTHTHKSVWVLGTAN